MRISDWSSDVCSSDLHEAMAALDLHHGRKPHALAADLRRAFSGIVAGNVKEDGMRRIEEFGPFQIPGDTDMMESLHALLRALVEPRRLKISGDYTPGYQVPEQPARPRGAHFGAML